MTSIKQTVSSKLYAGINSISSCSNYNRSHLLTPSCKGYVNPSFRLYSNQKRLRHLTRARKLDEKEEDEDNEYYAGEEEDDKEEDKDEYRAEEAVLKLYTDIKDRNINGVSEVIGDECQCFCNFLSSYRLLQGKKVNKRNICTFLQQLSFRKLSHFVNGLPNCSKWWLSFTG